MGSIEDTLRRREDVENDEIAAIIELAGELQDQARAERRQLSPSEVADIAEQLDIEAEFVEQAIATRREAAEQQRELGERERAKAAELAPIRKRRLQIAGLASAGALVVLVLVGGLLARSGANELEAATAEVDEARAKLEQVIQRSFAAAPQQLALVGGDVSLLESARESYADADALETKLAAAHQLDEAMARALAELPDTREQDASQMRLNLHYELVGFDNRLATELGRLELAHDRLRGIEDDLGVRLARAF